MKLILLLVYITVTFCKHFSKVYDLQTLITNQWIFLSKFGVDPGTGSLEARAKITNLNATVNYEQIQLHTYLDRNWNLVINEDSCKNKAKLATSVKDLSIPLQTNDWSPSITRKLKQVVREYVWYVALSDCSGKLNKYSGQKGVTVEIEITFINSNDSHFSSEDGRLHHIYLIQTIVTLGFVVFTWMRARRIQSESYDTNFVYVMILVSLTLDAIAESLLFIHYQIYSIDGEGSFAISLVGQTLAQVSQLVVSAALIMVAHGWTTRYTDAQQFQFYIPVGIMLVLTQILMVGVVKFSEEHDKHHDYHGVAGAFLMGTRVVLGGVFILFNILSIKKSTNQVQVFHEQFALGGSLYFLAFPILVIITQYFVCDRYRNLVISIGTILIQHLSLVILSIVFTSKKSQYNKSTCSTIL